MRALSIQYGALQPQLKAGVRFADPIDWGLSEDSGRGSPPGIGKDPHGSAVDPLANWSSYSADPVTRWSSTLSSRVGGDYHLRFGGSG